ncbi:hypothetical protein GLAREA_02700 [Glarea lozoyensis ATCC 20868]|uniref:Uncharacterized protein n=1 Tax=Glarea lozoyensis (strain ATCC 20868 / MF5171) TaxID=1116229 RepID=S3D429_GLAL2|nr:uncharacterized protein GLAREA_02700 [Glarea lozoyensis ATCC 20868]EPE26786.1 hypothetical protein GLAREA_02700 [Glarea lozoyensis ATCC 20868]
MSRQSKSSKHSHHSKSGGSSSSNNEDVVEQVKSIVTLLYEVVSSRPEECEAYIPSARSATSALDQIHFFRDPQRFAEQVWILHGLQQFAFYDADAGSIRDVTEFCQTSWLRILRNFPDNVEVLNGLGSNWLQRSQSTLAQIHQEEGDSSSQGSSSAGSPSDPRRQGPLYVEARGSLQPAVDFFARAVRSADANGTTTGELLASAAESQMSLGNVTAPPGDERHFSHAIRYLRRAEATPGYTLSVYMQQYLNDYGRYVS